jgi:porin
MLMPAPGDYEHTDITGFTVSQYLPIFGLSIVEAGKLDVVDLLTLFFPNVGYGQEGFWNANSQVSALPWLGAVQGLSLYGGIGATINQEHKIIQSGVVITGTENVSTRPVGKGSGGSGTWIAAFHRFLWKTDGDGHQGYLMIFAGGSTREQPSNDPHDFLIVPGEGIEDEDEEKPWDVALYLYQDFWQAKGDPKRKANFMFGGTAGPDNPQYVQYNLFANVEVFGLMDSRPRDRMGAAAYWNGLSDEYKDLVSPVADLEDIYGFEIYYNYSINKWLHLTPDLQIVDTAMKEEDTAVIAGLRLVVDF